MRFNKSLLIIVLITLAAAAVFSVVYFFNERNVYTIGIVNTNPNLAACVDGFKSEMAKYGLVEGTDIIYIDKGPLGTDDVKAALEDLVNKRVDLILAVTTPAAKQAKETVRGTGIPVVFGSVLSAVESGIVDTLIRPGGNLTGIQIGGSTPKALEWHKMALPKAKRIFVPCKCDDDSAEHSLSELKNTASRLGIDIVVAKVRTVGDLKSAFKKIPAEADSIWLLNSPFLVSNVGLFVEAAVRRKMLLSSGTSQYSSGVMISYGQKPFRTGEQAGRLAYKILKGISPADIPVETAEFFLGINLKTARAAGITIPHDVLLQADEIIR